MEVWENEKYCGNASRRRAFPQLFRVLPNFHECFYSSIQIQRTCYLSGVLCMVPHVNAVCQSSFFHLRNIGFIRKYLTYDVAKIIIHTFVVSKLDYCNSLLYGLSSYLIRKLQHVQNSAARLVNQCPRSCHITPVQRDLHWLLVSFRIEF